MKHWAEKYIGLPYKEGGNDPSGFDCWGFFRFVMREEFGIIVPQIKLSDYSRTAIMRQFREHKELVNWEKVLMPQVGDAVFMKSGKLPNHIGVYISSNNIFGTLHCHEKVGVMFSPHNNFHPMSIFKIHSFLRYKDAGNKS